MNFLQIFATVFPLSLGFIAIAFYHARKWATEDNAFTCRLTAPGVSHNGQQMYFENYQMPCRPISKEYLSQGTGRELMR